MNEILTSGELFPDGSAIELVAAGERLLLWTNGSETIGPSIDWAGATYKPALLEPGLLRALHFPAQTTDYGSVESLIGELSAETRDYLGLNDDQAFQAATFLAKT